MYGFYYGFSANRHPMIIPKGGFTPPPVVENQITFDLSKPRGFIWAGIL